MMNTTQTQPADRETMVSGWTDEEIEAYDAYVAECDRYADADLPVWPGTVDIGEPPF